MTQRLITTLLNSFKLKSWVLILLSFFACIALSAQSYVYDENGNRILLRANGTWELVDSSQSSFNTVWLKGNKYPATTFMELADDIKVSIINKAGQAVIIFGQYCGSEVSFYEWLWQGKVYLHLTSGERIILFDRDMKGIFEKNEKTIRYSCYYLTPSECKSLKRYDLTDLSYSTEVLQGVRRFYEDVDSNSDVLKELLPTLGF